MKNPVSLNTQLAKLREANNALKQIASQLSDLNQEFAASELKQVIYSLRDIQYKLRGIKQKIHRSAQTKNLSIIEIRQNLLGLTDELIFDDIPDYIRDSIRKANILLDTVEYYLTTNSNRYVKNK